MMLLVLSRVEKAADLMDPTFTIVTLNPAFLMDFVILFLLQIALHYGHIDQLDWGLVLQLVVTSAAPKVLVIPTNVKVTVPTNALALTVHSVAKVNWWLKQKLLATT